MGLSFPDSERSYRSLAQFGRAALWAAGNADRDRGNRERFSAGQTVIADACRLLPTVGALLMRSCSFVGHQRRTGLGPR